MSTNYNCDQIRCPYLDTINRGILDFDFEKCCSTSLSLVNIYACLVCGKYYQGRGYNTNAYTHCLENSHHMFLSLDNGSVWCLPDGYEVKDQSLDDVRSFLNPTFSKQDIESLDTNIRWSRAFDGTEYMPGLIGLNKMNANNYANVVIQILARVRPIRDFFLSLGKNPKKHSLLVVRMGELLRKIWNPKQFKGKVSPYEFMKAVIAETRPRYSVETGEPLTFLIWLLNTLHRALTSGKLSQESVITKTFQGSLEIGTVTNVGLESDKHVTKENKTKKIEHTKFFFLGLDLPPIPIFENKSNTTKTSQIPLTQLLKKYDGNINEDIKTGRKWYKLICLPNVLLLSIQRFNKNNYFMEKNPSIVHSPIKDLDLKDIIPLHSRRNNTKYSLIASISHEGDFKRGIFKIYVYRQIEDAWYEVQDLFVFEVLPQVVALNEAYLHVYENQKMSIID